MNKVPPPQKKKKKKKRRILNARTRHTSSVVMTVAEALSCLGLLVSNSLASDICICLYVYTCMVFPKLGHLIEGPL